MISKFVSKNQKDWNIYLPYLMMAHRSFVHDTMGETPCFMLMGREVTLPIDLVFGKHTVQEAKSLPDYVEAFINRMEKVHEVVRDRLMNTAERQKRRYDISCTFPSFKTGDGVLFQDNRKFKRRSPKFQIKWCEQLLLLLSCQMSYTKYRKVQEVNLKSSM
jgi:hypothetical protein